MTVRRHAVAWDGRPICGSDRSRSGRSGEKIDEPPLGSALFFHHYANLIVSELASAKFHLQRGSILQSYQAELTGSHLVWIDQPPNPIEHQRVLVVVENTISETGDQRMQAFLNARGCLGRNRREDVLDGLVALRDDWARDPLSGSASQ